MSYSQPQSSYDPAAIAADLHAALTEGLALFAGVDEACNNHRRFILGQTPGLAKFDGYDGHAWVSRQRYVDEPWSDLVALWAAYNRHLRHVISRTPAEHLLMSAADPD